MATILFTRISRRGGDVALQRLYNEGWMLCLYDARWTLRNLQFYLVDVETLQRLYIERLILVVQATLQGDIYSCLQVMVFMVQTLQCNVCARDG